MATNSDVASTEYQLRKYLLLLATLVATVTYSGGLNLPGGVWQDTQSEHHVGDSILSDAYHRRYLAFYYCNATSFAASLVVCLLLLVLGKQSPRIATVLRVVMVLDLLGLMGAYAAGSCRDEFTTIYSVVILSTVFAYLVPAFFAFAISNLPTKKNTHPEKQDASPDDESKHAELREVLMLLTTFVIAITYVAGLNPPGGFWGNTEDGHLVSFPILQKHHPQRYQAFFVCNTTAFVASLLIIILLLDKKLSKEFSTRFVALYVFIITALFGLVGAYTAGSSREHDNTTYVIGLGIAVLGYILLQLAIPKAINSGMKNKRCCQIVLTTYCIASKFRQSIQSLLFVSPHKETEQESRGTKHDQALEKARDLVILLATLVASITYQAGLDPPGGLWQDDKDGKGGDSVLLTTHPTRYKVFFYSNSTAFVVSLVVIIMVESRFLLKRHTLEAAMLLDLFGLICAYAAGSCRDVSTSIYVVSLAGVVLIYVVIHIIFCTLDHKDNHGDIEELDSKREVLLLLAILTATLTYQAGLTPPGGFWSADDNLGHLAGFPVLLDNYPRRYKAFFYCNAASFMASVALILLLVNPNLYRLGIRCHALFVCSMAGMFSLVGAYVAGSSRNLRTSIYVLLLAFAVLAFVTMQIFIFWMKWKNPTDNNENERLSADGTENIVVMTSFKEDFRPSQQGGDIHDNINEFTAQGFAFGTVDVPPIPRDKNKPVGSFGPRKKELREYLMLLGIMAASVTYQAGLKPPGGLWQDDKNGHAGNSILHDTDRRRYFSFFYSNSTSFMASIVVIVLLLPSTLHNYQLPLWPMHTAILLDMLGLLAAYAAGSNRDLGMTMKVIALIIPVLAYIAAYPVFSFFHNMARLCCRRIPCDDKNAKNVQRNVSSP